MTAVENNFESIMKGDNFDGIIYEVTDDSGTAIDISSYSFALWFRYGSKMGTIVKKIDTISGGITIVDGVNGKWQIDEFNCDFNAGLYYFDLQVTNDSGKIKTWFYGTMLVNEDVTDN